MVLLSIVFATRCPGFLIAVIVILSLGIVLLFYRKVWDNNRKVLSTSLIVLRALSVLLLLFIIFQPALSYESRRVQKGIVPILMDDSRSRCLRDGLEGEVRVETVKDGGRKIYKALEK